MSRNAQDCPSAGGHRLEAPAATEADGAARPSLRQLLASPRAQGERSAIVQLFPDPLPLRDTEDDPKWPAAIELIRDVGSRMRQARRFAQDVVQQSRAMIDATSHRLEETEHRLRLAEAAATEAQLRAERAEVAATMADARARRAEEETELNRAKLAEAQMWLRRLYSSVQIEFRDLNEDQH